MRCKLCAETETYFPNNQYLLINHLVEQHFTADNNALNDSFRDQKPYNVRNKRKLSAI